MVEYCDATFTPDNVLILSAPAGRLQQAPSWVAARRRYIQGLGVGQSVAGVESQDRHLDLAHREDGHVCSALGGASSARFQRGS